VSNYLTVRRVMFQEIDENGIHQGKTTYGVLASDNYAEGYTDIYESLEDLNKAIEEKGCILDVVDNGDFENVSRDGIGTNNYFGPVRTVG